MNNPFIERQNQLKRNILGGFTGILVASDEVQKAEDTEIEKAKHTPGETKNVNGKTYVWTEYKPGKFDWQVQKKKGESEWSGLSRKEKKSVKNEYINDYHETILNRYDVDKQTARKNAEKLAELVGKMDSGAMDFGEGNKKMREIWDSMKDKKKKNETALDKLSHDDPEAYEAVAGAGKESLKWLESQANSKDKIYAAAVKQRINEIKNDK